MSEKLASYKHEVGVVKKYSTEYTWKLCNYDLLYDMIYKEGITSSDFHLNGTNDCTCRLLLSPKTPQKGLTVQFSDDQDIETMEVDIRTGDIWWCDHHRKPVGKEKVYPLSTKKDVAKGISETDEDGAANIVVTMTIVKVSDSISLLNRMTLPHQMLSKSNPPRDVLSNFKMMFDRKAFCDVTFVVEDEIFYAHKAVLAAQSKVFEAMFLSAMKEQSANSIEIPNFDAEVFKQFLNYLYGEEEIQREETVREMIVMADFYNVSDLKIKCENIMLKSLSEDSAIKDVILADKINCETLKSAALRLIRKSSTVMEKALIKENLGTMSDLRNILSQNQSEDNLPSAGNFSPA